MKNREISGNRICVISEVNHCITLIWFNQKSSQTRKSSSEIDKYLRFIYDFFNEYGSWPNRERQLFRLFIIFALPIVPLVIFNPGKFAFKSCFLRFFVIQKYPKYGIDLNWSTLYKNAISLEEENGHHSFGSKFV